MGRALTVRDYINRARYLIAEEVEFCENPPLGSTSDDIEDRLSETLKLLLRTERLQDLTDDLGLGYRAAKDVLAQTVKLTQTVSQSRRFQLNDLLQDVIAETDAMRRRLKVDVYMMENRSYTVIDPARMIEAAFNAALACEDNYESARHETARPRPELAGSARRPAGG